MKLTFVSNYINHHQMPLANELYNELGYDYCFIQTQPMEKERVAMGWDSELSRLPYVKLLYENEKECKDLIMESDVVIFGWSGREDLVRKRLKTGKTTLRVSERIYREGQWKAISPRGLIAKYKEHIRYRKEPVCMLCAGAYTASDFHLIHAYPDKLFKWGYFPPLRTYEEGELEAKKAAFMAENTVYTVTENGGPLQIVWAGRFIPLKHPEYVVKAAKALLKNHHQFHVHMMGSGEMEEEIRQQVVEAGLSSHFSFYGFCTPDAVRDMMEKCHIHLFTSNHLEGWGAVVNEAMNSGCVEVCNAQVGAAPFLIEHGKNGLLYHKGSYKQFEEQVLWIFDHWDECKEIGQNAYRTIRDEWNERCAAKRLLQFCEALQQGKIPAAKNGPLSKAEILSPKAENMR